MSTYVFDLEANGLNPDTIWVICGKWSGDKQMDVLTDPAEMREVFKERVDAAERLVCHNLIEYDRYVVSNLLAINIPFMKSYDTLVLSRLLYPDRPVPQGVKGGPHSLEAWGVRVGLGKPEHEDWSQLSDEMIHRCQEDVRINELTWFELMREAR